VNHPVCKRKNVIWENPEGEGVDATQLPEACYRVNLICPVRSVLMLCRIPSYQPLHLASMHAFLPRDAL